MHFGFGFKSSTLLIFFIHGLVFTGLLIYKGIRSENNSSFWLASFLFLCSLYIAPFMFGYAGWYGRQSYRDILFYVPFQQLFLMPPLLYFYVKSLLNTNFTFQKKDWIHFIPAILYAVYSLVIWITDKIVLDEYYFYADGRDKDLALWYQVSGFIMMVFYLFKCLKIYTQYKKNTYDTVSYADAILYAWIQRFLIAFLGLLLIRTLFFILNPEWANFGNKYWYYLSFSILFYYIALSGYAHAIKMLIPFQPEALNKTLHANFLAEASEEKTVEVIDKSEAEITPADEILMKELEALMTSEQLFKNPSLTLFDVAQKLNTHPKKVSNVINKGFKMNFNDFVNTYRTQEVIKKVASNENDLKTLLGIALDSGFNSKSTFNRAFKKQTQQTPKEYFSKKSY
ncbi:AraC family transcriptional regulator [Kordia sp. YSTF-M3]|uniref:AraC family transcriptional regulator n=1 Tax=Kordia aestuariivivens TaxID=2759037 RepID=A0ABR7Q891_9FLAO|nr:helix-turn-helix domain-containing protein [Kordia aestuariivivens]MBC8754770.1 AraC family transcriptional regulator [Kordia aestuariivivens]